MRLPLGLLSTVLLALALPCLAGATESMEFTLRPATGNEAASRGYFVLRGEAGSSLRESLMLRNDTARPLSVRLKAVDAATGTFGGIGYRMPEDPVRSTGSWITLPDSSVQLEPNETRRIDFSVTLPKDARTGDHVAGITAWVPAEESAAAGTDASQASASVTTQMRRVVAVQVVVPGSSVAELTVSGVEAVARPDGMYLEMTIANTGTLLTGGSGVLQVADPAFSQDFSLGLCVPGTSIKYPVKWLKSPAQGDYSSYVGINYGSSHSQKAEWNGDIKVGDAQVTDLEEAADVPLDAGSAKSSTPWLIYGVIGTLTVIVLVLGVLLLRRRKPAPQA